LTSISTSSISSLGYQLSAREGKIGTPERPLSDLGYRGYLSLWQSFVIKHLPRLMGQTVSLKELASEIGLLVDDLIEALMSLNLIQYWKDSNTIWYIFY